MPRNMNDCSKAVEWNCPLNVTPELLIKELLLFLSLSFSRSRSYTLVQSDSPPRDLTCSVAAARSSEAIDSTTSRGSVDQAPGSGLRPNDNNSINPEDAEIPENVQTSERWKDVDISAMWIDQIVGRVVKRNTMCSELSPDKSCFIPQHYQWDLCHRW